MGEKEIRKLAELIEKSVEEDVGGKEVGVAFSGGVDSSLLAFLSKRYAKKVVLYTVGYEGAEDIEYAKILAEKLSLPIIVSYLDDDKAKELYKSVENFLHLGFIKSDILAPVEEVFRTCKEKYVVFGAGSEELFMGYQRHWKWWEEERLSAEEVKDRLREEFKKLNEEGGDIWAIKKLAERREKIALFPLYKEEIADFVYSLPFDLFIRDRERKKYIIREVARVIGIPKEAIERKKRALQYGSGIHKKLMKMKRRGEI